MALSLLLQTATILMTMSVGDLADRDGVPTRIQVECKRYGIAQAQEQLKTMQGILSPILQTEVASPEVVAEADASYRAFIRTQVVGFKGVPTTEGLVDVKDRAEVDEVFASCWDSRGFNAELQRIVIEVLTKG